MNTLIRYGATESVFAEAADHPGLHLARVTSQYKGVYKIAAEQGESLAEVSGKLRHESDDLANYPAVGDFVMICQGEADSGNAVIHRILKRKSFFARAAVGHAGQTQIVAANIDIAFICMSLNNDYNFNRLERYLAIAWKSGALPSIILTKSDLCERLPDVLEEIAAVAPGVAVCTTSINDQASHDTVRSYLKPGITASFIGSSGVGKSTLINCLAGEEIIRTSSIREDGRGRHTTTRREMLLLPQGGIVIDTPGMRELGIQSADIAKSFADVESLTAQCRFHDCAHGAEPGCAVRHALETGELNQRRWNNYVKLTREAEYSALSSRQLEVKKLNGMFESIGGMKKARNSLRQKDKRR